MLSVAPAGYTAPNFTPYNTARSVGMYQANYFVPPQTAASDKAVIQNRQQAVKSYADKGNPFASSRTMSTSPKFGFLPDFGFCSIPLATMCCCCGCLPLLVIGGIAALAMH